MNKIKILSPVEAQKIAAGEVIERPASVVKELIENSIDAGATEISLHIKKAGKQLIRIIDNGCGMSPQDALLSIKPHATSKISSALELDNLTTFGFRGEALSAVSSISKLTLQTKSSDQGSLGLKFYFDSSVLVESSEVALNVGTDLIIEDLFFNVPARKKFLKQDETEWNQIENIFYAFCLSHCNIHFKLYRDDKFLFNIPPVTNLVDRVAQLWDSNFAQNLIELSMSNELDKISISGLVTYPQSWYYNKNNIYFFVNDRFVRNSGLTKALIKGYLNVLPQGRFPAGFVFLNLDLKSVDVNVHPRKEEVKFSRPQLVEDALFLATKTALEKYVSSKIKTEPTFNDEIKNLNLELRPLNNKSITIKIKDNPIDFSYENFNFEKISSATSQINEVKAEISEPDFIKIETQPKINFVTEVDKKFISKVIGQFFNTYILIELEAELVIIDQHAAHERILYEKFKTKFEKVEGTSLLFPEILEFKQINIILEWQDLLNDYGIELEEFGPNLVVIKSTPPILQNSQVKELILELMAIIEENNRLEKEALRKIMCEHMHAQMACKAAIKAGDILSHENMNQLIEQLYACNNRLICVHGRPTMWTITRNQLERNFQRKL